MKIKYIYIFLVPPKAKKSHEIELVQTFIYNSKTNEVGKFIGSDLSNDTVLQFGFLGAGVSILGITKLPINILTIFVAMLTGFSLAFYLSQRFLLKHSETAKMPLRAFDEDEIRGYKLQNLKILLIMFLTVVSGILIVIYLMYQFDSPFFLFFLFLLGCLLQIPSFFIWDILTDKALKLIKKNYLPNGKVEEKE